MTLLLRECLFSWDPGKQRALLGSGRGVAQQQPPQAAAWLLSSVSAPSPGSVLPLFFSLSSPSSSESGLQKSGFGSADGGLLFLNNALRLFRFLRLSDERKS